MTPVLSEEQMKDTVSKFNKFLVDKGAEVMYEDIWGLRKLAYPIQKKTTGFYCLLAFKAEGSVIADLEIAFKRDERIIRFLTFVLDKHAIAYSEKRRANRAASAEIKAEA
jgi:small subunit ribosomal protein S6